MKVGLKRGGGGEESGRVREEGQDLERANNEILSCSPTSYC